MQGGRRAATKVIQTFRNTNIPDWIQRCLDSVRRWAVEQGHDYELAGDEFYNLCGPDYLVRGSKNPQALTNLARLVATRRHLDAGYRQVIWMDADMFIFDPRRLVFDFPAGSLTTGYAFGREVWLMRSPSGVVQASVPMAHNAATLFTQNEVDLDLLIALIRHIDAKRAIVSNYQVGVGLLRGLQYPLMFQTFSHAALFSPELIRGLADRDDATLQIYGEAYRYRSCAANLCLSLEKAVTSAVMMVAMDRLEASCGDALNRYAADQRLALVPLGG